MPGSRHIACAHHTESGSILPGIDARHVVAAFGTGDVAVAEVARLQHGAVSVTQLRACGLSTSAIRVRAQAGRLHPVHRGVYRVGHTARSLLADLACAALAAGPDTAAWAHTACFLHGFVSAPSMPAHFAGVGVHRRDRKGVRMHRVAGLARDDVSSIQRLPVVSAPFALLSFAARTTPEATRRALNEARILDRSIDRQLCALRDRRPSMSGWGTINSLLVLDREPDVSRSEAELRLLRLVTAAGLPGPRRNVEIKGYKVDFFWPDHGLIAEVDGYGFHSSRSAFERDREKWARLEDGRLRVIVFTWRQILQRRTWVVAQLASRLERGKA